MLKQENVTKLRNRGAAVVSGVTTLAVSGSKLLLGQDTTEKGCTALSKPFGLRTSRSPAMASAKACCMNRCRNVCVTAIR